MQSKPGATPLEANPVTHKYSTVALVPVSEDVPLTAFTYELYHSLCALGIYAVYVFIFYMRDHQSFILRSILTTYV